jgi:hypothetical protein
MDRAAPSVRLRTDERYVNSPPSVAGPLIRRLSRDAGQATHTPVRRWGQRLADAPNSSADTAASHRPGRHRIPIAVDLAANCGNGDRGSRIHEQHRCTDLPGMLPQAHLASRRSRKNT